MNRTSLATLCLLLAAPYFMLEGLLAAPYFMLEGLLAALVRVALGLWLFLGFRPLVRFWPWAQTAGLDRKSPSRA